LASFFAQLPLVWLVWKHAPARIFWARKLTGLGHTVKLMASQFVQPFVKSNKNDTADAEAICEAVGRPTMRFVPIKNNDQQTLDFKGPLK
jgi:transposase